MEDTEANDPSVETLNEQYKTVVAKTTASPVLKFGEFDFMSEPIGDFEGTCEPSEGKNLLNKIKRKAHKLNKKAKHFLDKVTHHEHVASSALVDSRDHDLEFWKE